MRPLMRSAIGFGLASILWLSASSSAAAARGAVVQHATGQSADAVREYWTAARMRRAEPVDPPPGPDSGAVGATAPTFYAQPPDQEIDPALDTVFPHRIHGSFFFTSGGKDASCSATVVTARSRDLIMTAGHCVALPAEVTGIGTVWASNVLFVPGYRKGAAPFGRFPATRLGATRGWLRSADIAFDLGTANLAPGAGGRIQDQLGARGVAFNRPPKSYRNDLFEIYGYPSQPREFYDGERPILCFSSFQDFERFSGSPVAGPCHQQQGSSGGGLVRKGQVQSVVSHGACDIPSTACEFTAGTYFGEVAFQLYRRSSGGIAKGKRKRLKRCKRFDKPGRRARCRGRVQRFKPDPR